MYNTRDGRADEGGSRGLHLYKQGVYWKPAHAFLVAHRL